MNLINAFANAQPAVQAAIISGLILLTATLINLLSATIIKFLDIRSKNQEWVRDNKNKSIEEIIEGVDKAISAASSFKVKLFVKFKNSVAADATILSVMLFRQTYSTEKFVEEVFKSAKENNDFIVERLDELYEARHTLGELEASKFFWISSDNNIKESLENTSSSFQELMEHFIEMCNEASELNVDLMLDLTDTEQIKNEADIQSHISRYREEMHDVDESYRLKNNDKLRLAYTKFDKSVETLLSKLELELKNTSGVNL